jgi:hypothetical protein
MVNVRILLFGGDLQPLDGLNQLSQYAGVKGSRLQVPALNAAGIPIIRHLNRFVSNQRESTGREAAIISEQRWENMGSSGHIPDTDSLVSPTLVSSEMKMQWGWFRYLTKLPRGTGDVIYSK